MKKFHLHNSESSSYELQLCYLNARMHTGFSFSPLTQALVVGEVGTIVWFHVAFSNDRAPVKLEGLKVRLQG